MEAKFAFLFHLSVSFWNIQILAFYLIGKKLCGKFKKMNKRIKDSLLAKEFVQYIWFMREYYQDLAKAIDRTIGLTFNSFCLKNRKEPAESFFLIFPNNYCVEFSLLNPLLWCQFSLPECFSIYKFESYVLLCKVKSVHDVIIVGNPCTW